MRNLCKSRNSSHDDHRLLRLEQAHGPQEETHTRTISFRLSQHTPQKRHGTKLHWISIRQEQRFHSDSLVWKNVGQRSQCLRTKVSPPPIDIQARIWILFGYGPIPEIAKISVPENVWWGGAVFGPKLRLKQQMAFISRLLNVNMSSEHKAHSKMTTKHSGKQTQQPCAMCPTRIHHIRSALLSLSSQALRASQNAVPSESARHNWIQSPRITHAKAPRNSY